MMASVECAQLFQVLVKSTRAKRCLEVGCFTGYTTLSLASALPDDGQVFTLDLNRDVVAFDIWKKAGVDRKVNI